MGKRTKYIGYSFIKKCFLFTLGSVCRVNPSHRSVCLYVHLYALSLLGKTPTNVAKQRLGKNVTAATIWDVFGRVVFYAIGVVQGK
jgi:hypothetical protein